MTGRMPSPTPPPSPEAITRQFGGGNRRRPVTARACLSPAKEVDEEDTIVLNAKDDDEQEILDEEHSPLPVASSLSPTTPDYDPFRRGSPLVMSHSDAEGALPSQRDSGDFGSESEFEEGPSIILVAQRVSRANSPTSPTSPNENGGRIFVPARRGSLSSIEASSQYTSQRSASGRSSFASASSNSAHSSVTSQGFANMLSR
jgi:hypothetical protein